MAFLCFEGQWRVGFKVGKDTAQNHDDSLEIRLIMSI